MSGQVRNNLLRVLQQFVEQKVLSSIEHLPSVILGVSARFTKSDVVEPKMVRSFNFRERHVITTWVDRKGGARCMCIGSTQYDMHDLNGEFCSSCCIHAQAVTEVLQELCKSIFRTSSVHIRVIYSEFAALYAQTVESINRPLPNFRSLHGGKTILYIPEDISQENQLCWIPIRKVQRSGVRLLCAFCDLVNPNKCFHVSAFRRFFGEDLVDQTNSNSCEANEEVLNDGDPDPFILSNELNQSSIKKNHQPISTISISPVNCPLAMRVNQEVCDLLEANCVFALKAPVFCTNYKCTRIENTREVNSSVVIVCSLGACAMEIETVSVQWVQHKVLQLDMVLETISRIVMSI